MLIANGQFMEGTLIILRLKTWITLLLVMVLLLGEAKLIY